MDINYAVIYVKNKCGDLTIMDEHCSENYIGIEDAAKYLDMKVSTIRTWIKEKKFPAHKIGKLWKFKLCEIDAWVNRDIPMNLEGKK